jgi:hypothetical protein
MPIIHRLLNRFLLGLLCTGMVAGQVCAESGGEAAVKTAFLYNFLKFIDWPDAVSHQDAYHLCTTNNDQLGDSLMVLANKSVNNKPIVIHRDIAGKDLKTCHMVFIAASENAAALVNDLKNLPIVTISDKAGFIQQNGIIGLVQIDNRLGFEINLDQANSAGIHIQAQLLKLAKYVKSTH